MSGNGVNQALAQSARSIPLIDVQVLNEPRVVIEVRHTKFVDDDLT
jgi:hypothetical protein